MHISLNFPAKMKRFWRDATPRRGTCDASTIGMQRFSVRDATLLHGFESEKHPEIQEVIVSSVRDVTPSAPLFITCCFSRKNERIVVNGTSNSVRDVTVFFTQPFIVWWI